MLNIELYNLEILDFVKIAKVSITPTDYFSVFKSSQPTLFFFNNYRSYDHNNNLILDMIGDDRIPDDLIENTLRLMRQKLEPEPPKVQDDSQVIYGFGNKRIISTDEYSREYRRAKQLSGLKRGTFNPNS